ncbi:asparagine synthase C-terminal domain-containing protein [Caldisphaera lagunensis]|uniref:asparagine synthase C-terminal domain-containing protein n=1 Tax=Caldisphaera lagunensis TaxID=200415 RepID=UPI0006624033|nr:asparagine synthase-related protein [Caldisphaera lagunensis]
MFSGGIDTTFILMSLINEKPKTISVVFNESKDKEYIDYVKNKLNIENYEIIIKNEQEIGDCLNNVLYSLKVIDPIEIISGVSVCLGLKKAKELKCNCIITGDGGDELYFGYDFLLNRNESYLNNWLKNVLNNAFFNSIPISNYMGIKAILPLYSNESKELSLSIPTKCKINEINGKIYGKYFMRLWLMRKGLEFVALRNKTPITIGTGSEILLQSWKNKVKKEEIQEYKNKYRINFPSLSHFYLFKKGLELGIFNDELENKSNKNPCPICGHEMKGNHCKFCGTYIDEKGQISYYKDF